MTDLELVRTYALCFVGVPYHWGGATPMEGEDCSHLVCEILQAFGILPHDVFYTSKGLSLLKYPKVDSFDFGDLAFFGADADSVEHVGFCLNESQMINAAGGGVDTTNISVAIQRRAFVKIRPVHYRKDFLFAIRPPWGV